MSILREAWRRYKLRLKHRRLLLRAIRKRRELSCAVNRTKDIQPNDILCFATVRNESVRLPYFLKHHRALGVSHFLIVDNASDDGTTEYLKSQSDVSLWITSKSYRASRFGMDWLTWLQMRYGRGHWCATLDADEALIIPHHDSQNLRGLTDWLDARGVPVFSTLMLDLYPKTRLTEAHYSIGAPFTEALGYYDAQGYEWELQPKYRNISIRGGPRKRKFFNDTPELAPHMHKTPLIKWNWRYVYASSTHIILPTRLNIGFDARYNLPTGVLLHAKFLDEALKYSTAEAVRQEHFTHPQDYNAYYDHVLSDPILWDDASRSYRGWRGLEEDGLLVCGDWV